jgi:DNA-binding MarR family transcriptional regulator
VPASAADDRIQRLLDVEQAISMLNQAARARTKEYAERFDAELQPAGFGILRYVAANEPVRAGGIAAALAIDKSAVSRQLTVLRDGGLIETRADPADGRATLLVTTEKARIGLAEFRSNVHAAYERIMADWDTGDIADFAAALQRFTSGLS